MIIMDRPESLLAVLIIVFIAFVAVISTYSNWQSDKKTKKLKQENEILKTRCDSLTEYATSLVFEKEQNEYKNKFFKNISETGDKNEL